MAHLIPPITDPLGRSWQQPSLAQILVDDTHAVMTPATLNTLLEYNTSRPSGVYPGKMWKSYFAGAWYLNWYGEVPDRPEVCSVNRRKILLTETSTECWWCKTRISLPLDPTKPYPRRVGGDYVCSYDCKWEHDEHYK